jgi:hypothetical protein
MLNSKIISILVEKYQHLIGFKTNIAELLAMPGAEDLELSFPTTNDLPIAADFS